MKTSLVLLIGFICLPQAYGAAAQVTKSTAGNHLPTGNSQIIDTLAGASTGATLLLFQISASSGVDPGGFTCFDQIGGVTTANNWHHTITYQPINLNGVVLWYAYDSGTSATLVTDPTPNDHVFKCTGIGGVSVVSVWAYAFSGTKTSSTPYNSARDKGTQSTSNTTLTTASVTPATAGDLLFSACNPRTQNVSSVTPLTLPPDSIAWVSGTVSGVYNTYQAAANTTAVAQTCTLSGTGTLSVNLVDFEVAPPTNPARHRVSQ